MTTIRAILLLAIGGVVLASNSLAQVTVTATVDRTRIGLNEDFTLSVEVSGGNAGEPQLPAMESFARLAGTSSSQSIQIINGRMSSSHTYHYTFIAVATGSFEIGPVEVAAGGQTYRSAPIRIEILPAAGGPPAAPGAPPPQTDPGVTADGSLFLRAEVDRKQVYVNQPVIVTFKIYTARNVRNYGNARLPTFTGFWVEDFPMPRQPRTYQQVINGQRYLVAEVKRTAIFPQTAGRSTIEAMSLDCEVAVAQRRRPRDLFDSFFDDPFFAPFERVTIASRPVTIEVLPLPAAGKPAGFAGAVGNYTLSATVDRSTLKVNEAITLTVKISGQGNIKTLPAPAPELPPDFEVYDPKVSQDVEHGETQISGSKTWEYVMVPRFAGTHVLKPITFAYFDPRTRQYVTASSKPITLTVDPGTGEYSAVTLGGASKEDVRLLGQDIRFIAINAAPLQRLGAANYTSAWFVTLLVLPVAGFLGALVWQRHQAKLASNVAYARSRRAAAAAQRQLKAARKRLQANDSKGFYAEVQRALTGFLGNKLNVAEAGLVTERIEQLLREKNVAPALISDYLNCLYTCDYQRFAPATATSAEMQQFYQQAAAVLEQLEDAL
ncbi:MAG: BatD family protein [candidate division KSB1 bacterium]|nr:BatD family protein [candidate division KSB1 bacterium]MDZ7284827.1 BatD family protein [candidate division KSB1 bacterium]MDZ7348619.1 BatD family protein [candidate division KSB1 bacterium]MDZ7352420.1 BatD family protein [candidate division KSB1 bacterium]MDZ7382252.1 BatD family protein [candidate division KSB1 bacterium]